MKVHPSLRRCLGTVAALVLVAAGCVERAPVAPGDDVAQLPPLSALAGGDDLGHVLLAANGAAPTADLIAAIEAAGGTVRHRHDIAGVLEIDGLSDAAAAGIRQRTDVAGIDRDVILRWVPSAEEFGLRQIEGPSAETDQSGAAFFAAFQWNMRQVEADDAWLNSPQGAGALVCVLDSGVDPGQLDLNGKVNLAVSTSFVPTEPFIEDLFFHGTFVSALVSSNGIAMASVAPDADLCAVKVLDLTGSGAFSWVIDGIIHAADVGADVINMSLGAHVLRSESAALIDALQAAIAYANNQGTLVVASAGNAGVNLDDFPGIFHIPSQLSGVLSVGATAPVNQMNFDALASYSNFGKSGVDVAAPGGDFVEGGVFEDLILSACSQFVCGAPNFYVFAAGTSFSSPHAAGQGAVLESNMAGDQGAAVLQNCIRSNADKLDGLFISPIYGSGRINVLRSVLKPSCRGSAGGGGGGGDPI